MAAKNQIACFDKTWKVKNITLERSDLEKDGNIRYTGRDIYREASVILINGAKTTVIKLKNLPNT